MRSGCRAVGATLGRWMVEALMVVVIFAAIQSSAGFGGVRADATAASEAVTVQHDDVCQDDGRALQCPSGHALHVQGARCAGVRGQHSSCGPEVLETLFRLCHGRGSCAGLGLAQVFGTHCHPSRASAAAAATDGHVVVSYTCRRYAEGSAPPCTFNLCSNVTQGLRCPRGTVVHVRNVTCGAGRGACAQATPLTLYSLCEGREGCDASGLRMLKPVSMYCGHSADPRLRNVFVDFVCLPDQLIEKQCHSQPVNLSAPFGVVMSPGFVGQVKTAPVRTGKCNWLLTPRDRDDVVHLTVHMAYSRWQSRGCYGPHFMRVIYKDCELRERVTRRFCDLSDVNVPIRSCGSVRITSWLQLVAEDNARYLLSYQVVPRGIEVVSPPGVQECRTPVSIPPPPTFAQSHTTRPTYSHRNYGPGRTMFDYSDTIRHVGSDSQVTNQDEDDTFQLKLILLYIFFGVVIMALLIALIYVLMSYRGISRRNRHGSDSSEKTALWRHEDTPLHTFSQNSHVTLVEVANSDLYPPPSPPPLHTQQEEAVDKGTGSPDSQVVSCTVHSKSPQEEEEFRLSTGSAFSSFLSGRDMDLQDLLESFHTCQSVAPKDGGDYDIIAGKDGEDYESVGGKDRGGDYDTITGTEGGDYDSIKGDMPRSASARSNSLLMNGDAGNIYESIDDQRCRYLAKPAGIVDRHDDTDRSPPPAPHVVPSHDPSYVEHYTINDDDYALVRKPKGSGKGGVKYGTTTTQPPQVLDVTHSCASGVHDAPGQMAGVPPTGQPAN